MRIAVGSDHRGSDLRTKIVEQLRGLGYEAIEDLGTDSDRITDYPDIAAMVAGRVSSGQADRGILIGATGLEMSIVANKYQGVRAGMCSDVLLAETARRYMDLNVLCLSADLTGEATVEQIVRAWLDAPFEGGRHGRRVDKIADVERDVSGQGHSPQ